jgi:hypothetical protein
MPGTIHDPVSTPDHKRKRQNLPSRFAKQAFFTALRGTLPMFFAKKILGRSAQNTFAPYVKMNSARHLPANEFHQCPRDETGGILV